MNIKYPQLFEAILKLTEDEVLEVFMTKDSPILEENRYLNRKRVTFKHLVIALRKDLAEKYKLIIAEDDKEQYYD